jgi:formamidopyrimidine-DNA glycosylase
VPELPEVETVARDLRGLILGATITGVAGDWPRAIASHPSVAAFAEAVSGRRVEAVGRRAKLVVVELSGDTPPGRGPAALTIHLKMTGQLFVLPAGAAADPHVHLRLALDDGRELRFRDIRKFGRVGCWPLDPVTGEPLSQRAGADGAAGEGLFAAFGPEPLDDAFTLRVFRARLRGRRGRLKPLLLDQRFVAGVGNIYADEALWRARLHPLRGADTLRPPDEARLHRELRAILAEAVERRGSSIDDYTAPDGDGSMQERLDVYQRTGEPCPRCGRPIRRIVVGARATHFCSWCQRLPAADRAGAIAILRAARAPATKGRRWTEVAVEGSLGLTPDEAERAAAKARAERTRRASATRRAEARGGADLGARAGAGEGA